MGHSGPPGASYACQPAGKQRAGQPTVRALETTAAPGCAEYARAVGHEGAGDIECRDQKQAGQREPEEEAGEQAGVHFGQLGAFCHAEAAQLHRTDNILGSHQRATDDRDKQRRQTSCLAKETTAHLLNLETTRTLGVKRIQEIAHRGRRASELVA